MRIRAALTTFALATAGALALAPAAHAAGTTYTWVDLGNDSNWSTAANWSPQGVPGNGDSVIIQSNAPNTNCATAVDAPPTVTLQNLTVRDLNVGGNDCVARLHAGGTITVAGDLQFHGQEIDTPIVIASGATGTISPSTDPVAAEASRLGANVTVQGRLTLANNTYSDTSDQSVLFTDADLHIAVASGGTLATTGVNHVKASGCCLSPSGITNGGTLDVNGTLDLDSTELDQNGALVTHASSDAVTSYFAPNTAGDGATWSGPGTYRVTYASASDTLTGMQTLGAGFRFLLGGGTSPGGHAPDGNESLNGTFTFTGAGKFVWAGGEIAANLTVAHGTPVTVPADIAGDARTLTDSDGGTGQPAALVNHGTIAVATGATIDNTGNSVLDNRSDGVLSLAPGSLLDGDCCSTHGTVLNTGLVTVPTGSSSVAAVLDGVAYQATGGKASIATGRTLVVTGGADSQLYSTRITGGGTFTAQSPFRVSKTVTVDTATTLALGHGSRIEDVVVTGGVPESAALAGAGSVVWTGGALAGRLTVATGAFTVSGTAENKIVAETTAGAAASSVTVTAPTTIAAGTSDSVANVVELDSGSTLNLNGATTAGGNVQIDGGNVVNRGTLTAQPAAGTRVYVADDQSFVNSGTVNVTSGTLAVDSDYRQTAGTTTVSSGAQLQEVGSSAKFRLAGGTLAGTGTIRGQLVNSAGTVRPAASATGTLSVIGRYTQSGTGVLAIDLAASTRDLLAVQGGVALGGTLAVTNAYTPNATDKWTIVTATSAPTGSFACTTTTGTGSSSRHWVPAVSGNTVVITSVAGAKTTC